ncbi:hypothetical protein Tco_0319350 [Tanacetum coccineum]
MSSEIILKSSLNSITAYSDGFLGLQGSLALARITSSNANEARGCCKKCSVGHLTFQCRNFLSIKDDKDKDPEAIQATFMLGLEKIKGHMKISAKESSYESDEEEKIDVLNDSSQNEFLLLKEVLLAVAMSIRTRLETLLASELEDLLDRALELGPAIHRRRKHHQSPSLRDGNKTRTRRGLDPHTRIDWGISELTEDGDGDGESLDYETEDWTGMGIA